MKKSLDGRLGHEVEHFPSREDDNRIVGRVPCAPATALRDTRPDSVLEYFRQLQFRPEKIFLEAHGRGQAEQDGDSAAIVGQVDAVVSSRDAQYGFLATGEDVQGVFDVL